MNETLLPPEQWVQLEFAGVDLCDQRRNRRLVSIASRLAKNPGGTLPQAFPTWKELKAAYRFFRQGKVRSEEILQPHWQRTRQSCSEAGEYLLIEDTTELDYSSRRATVGLGPIGDGGGRGLYLHSTLAVRVDGWNLEQQPEETVVGLVYQQCWSHWSLGPSKRSRGERLSGARKSQRWAAVFDEMGGPAAGVSWIYIADAESDFYEPIVCCQRHGVDFIIRGYQDRVLAGREQRLAEALGEAEVVGRMRVEVRARPGQEARSAEVEVRRVSVVLNGPWRPGGKRADFAAKVVEVREVNEPEGAEPLHWVLLTSLPCRRWVEVRRIVARYVKRWLIEEYHQALKSGTQVEESQMREAYQIESLVAVLGVVAVRLLNAKLLARARGEELVDKESFGAEALELLGARYGQPERGWTHQSLLIAVARLGGFPARKGDGLPGWKTIWRGWQRLMWMVEGLESLDSAKLISNRKRCG